MGRGKRENQRRVRFKDYQRGLTGICTKCEVIDLALRTLVRLHEQSSASDLRGKLHWEGDLDESRLDRTNAGN